MSGDDFSAYLVELLQPPGAVRVRRMFGGYGLYREELMFGLVADSTLYLKVDNGNRAQFEALGLEPFVYQKKGKPMTMSYYRVPADALDDSEALCRWAESAYAAALRASSAKRKR